MYSSDTDSSDSDYYGGPDIETTSTIDDRLYQDFLDSCREGHLHSVVLYCESQYVPLNIQPIRIAFEHARDTVVCYLLKSHRNIRLELILDESESTTRLLRDVMTSVPQLFQNAGFRNDVLQFRADQFLEVVKKHPEIILDYTYLRKTLLQNFLLLYIRVLFYNQKQLLQNKTVSYEIQKLCPELYYTLYPQERPYLFGLNPFLRFCSVFYSTMLFMCRFGVVFVAAFAVCLHVMQN